MAKPTAQQVHALITYFVNAYAATVGHAPVVNRNKVRRWFENLLMDYSTVEAREFIDYYLSHYDTPTVEWFSFNYEKVIEAKQDKEKNDAAAVRRRAETQQRLKEWRERWQK